MTPPETGPAGAAPSLALTVRTPEDLLALAPVVLGFFPADSVVMLTFGARHPFHARVDLPTEEPELAEVVELLVDPARRHGVHRVVLLVYAADHALSARLWQRLDAGFSRAGIDVVEALRVEERRWFVLAGADELDPGPGVPFDVASHPFRVRAVVEGRVTHDSRAALAATLGLDDEAAARVLRLVAVRRPAPDPLLEGTWLEQTLRRDLARGDVPDEATLARVLVAVQDLRLRDAAWSVLTPEHAPAAVAWWTHALTRSPRAWSAAPAALLAWSAWLHGNGALAWCALDRCAATEPDYGLARIVADLLERARPPSSWQGAVDWRSTVARTSPTR